MLQKIKYFSFNYITNCCIGFLWYIYFFILL